MRREDLIVDGGNFSAMPLDGLEPSVSVTVLLYSSLIFLGYFSHLGIRKIPETRMKGNTRALIGAVAAIERRLAGRVAMVLLFLLVIGSMLHFIEVDKDLLWRNYNYLSIKTPDEMGITSTFGRVYHILLRIIGFISVAGLIYYFNRGYTAHALLCLCLAAYGFIFMLAGNSRWAPLYCVLAACFWAYDRKRAINIPSMVFSLAAFWLFLKVIYGRGGSAQGLSEIFTPIPSLGFDTAFGYVVPLCLNIFEGALNFANSVKLMPVFEHRYILLSFSPLLSSMDGFDSIADTLNQKFAVHVPMGGLGEVWHFGVMPLSMMLLVYFLFLRYTTAMFCSFVGLAGVAVAAPALYVILALQSYSFRTSWRFMLLLTAISFVFVYAQDRRSRNETRG